MCPTVGLHEQAKHLGITGKPLIYLHSSTIHVNDLWSYARRA